MTKVAVISGYKPFEVGIFKNDAPAVSYIKTAIRKSLLSLLDDGLEWVIISGQLGAELWAAEVVYDLQIEGYEDLKLAVITPCLDQEASWKAANKEWYESILVQADFVDSVTKKPYESPLQFRLKNHFLVSKSDVLLLFYDMEKEGSPKYLYETAKKYQEENEYDIRLITFYDLQLVVEEEQLSQRDSFE
ncbi:hypothetical protein ABE67_06095 [Cytobacillus firmus]|uniref:DUF1273 domain-containing protein n=1 Tax=Cytobacillus firmus TaxID=1399 RepID=UPI0018CCC96F|nr:DUF1273 domain-containing protein [Cytobacillus firmus]MBG9448894.1 hypothetical protein [Cytobacillus firmus]